MMRTKDKNKTKKNISVGRVGLAVRFGRLECNTENVAKEAGTVEKQTGRMRERC